MRILLADDAALLREGLAGLLAAAGHEVVAQVADADALRTEVERLAARERADPERLQLIIWSCLQGYTRLIAVGAASADPDFIRAALHTVITIGDHS